MTECVRELPRACLERPTGGAPVQGPRPVSPTRHGANREPKADGAPRRDTWHRARQERGGASRELGPTSRRRAAAAADVTLLNAARPEYREVARRGHAAHSRDATPAPGGAAGLAITERSRARGGHAYGCLRLRRHRRAPPRAVAVHRRAERVTTRRRPGRRQSAAGERPLPPSRDGLALERLEPTEEGVVPQSRWDAVHALRVLRLRPSAFVRVDVRC